MRMDALRALPILALAGLTLGWALGYRDFSAYLTFGALCALLIGAAIRLARGWFGASGVADTLIRTTILAFALIVAAGLTLGAAGLVSNVAYLAMFAVGFAATLAIRQPPRTTTRVDVPLVIAAVVVPMLAFIIGVGAVKSPMTLYDSLSYHLFFPARWLQEHRLSIIPTPFSDEAQAYAPGNGELVFLWMMLPFHGDLAARLAQIPFYLLGGVLLFALARRMGARPLHAAYAPVFYFVTKRVVEQVVGADVDLVCWSMFLASIYVGFVAIETNARRDWALWGICLGLYFGTKYVALVYAPVLVALPLVARPRLRQVWALPGLVMFALPWYLRNWIVAGSPIYPSSLSIAGVTVAQGAYTHAAMANSILHSTEIRYLPVMLSLAFGTTVFFFWIPGALVGAWRLLSSGPRWPHVFLLVAPMVMAFLNWFAVPDNLDCRFLLPVTMLAWLPVVFAFGRTRIWNGVVHVVLIAGLLWIAVGWHGELPVEPLPWPIGNWLTFGGFVGAPYVLIFLGLAAATIVLVRWTGVGARHFLVVLTALTIAAGASLALTSRRWCPPDGCDFLELSPTYIHTPTLLAWAWVRDHVSDATIAYAGNNLPYPLTGERLTNRVRYVNIDYHQNWRFHDYDRFHRRTRATAPADSLLAVSSGMLKPLPDPPQWHSDAVRPRYERMQGDRAVWINNLKTAGVRYLFVSALSVYERDFMWHTADGFPIEDEWARTSANGFRVVYENSDVRIFEVHPE